MIDPRLNALHQALTAKADAVQREFAAVSSQLQTVGRQMVNTPHGATGPLREEQAGLRERQLALAAEINLWRDRARAVLRQRDDAAVQAFMLELEAAGDPDVTAAVRALRAAAAWAAENPGLDQAARDQPPPSATPAGRLLERARLESALRADDPAARQREAVALANRPGLAQDEAALAELEAAQADRDPAVSDLAVLALIQVHRFRALRLSELEPAHVSVRWLARVKHRAALPVLIEILETPRTGYVPGPSGMVEGHNQRSRLVALAALTDWRTAAGQSAIRNRLRDRDQQIAAAAERALAVFPGEWS